MEKELSKMSKNCREFVGFCGPFHHLCATWSLLCGHMWPPCLPLSHRVRHRPNDLWHKAAIYLAKLLITSVIYHIISYTVIYVSNLKVPPVLSKKQNQLLQGEELELTTPWQVHPPQKTGQSPTASTVPRPRFPGYLWVQYGCVDLSWTLTTPKECHPSLQAVKTGSFKRSIFFFEKPTVPRMVHWEFEKQQFFKEFGPKNLNQRRFSRWTQKKSINDVNTSIRTCEGKASQSQEGGNKKTNPDQKSTYKNESCHLTTWGEDFIPIDSSLEFQ